MKRLLRISLVILCLSIIFICLGFRCRKKDDDHVITGSSGQTGDTWTWTVITTTNAPEARFAHTAIWTGEDMIIWGGYSTGPVYYGNGAKYNPISNTWTTITTTNAPSGRTNPSAIWTGQEMIIWGGYNGEDLNTGAKYNPISDTWAAITTTNAPSARVGHTVIWTGDSAQGGTGEMLIWGGTTVLNTGAKYNPISNTWTTITTTNVPEGRDGHTAIWTGEEMIIWGGGGAGGDNYLNSGAKYYPLTDTWVTITTTDAPYKRYLHTAVWTGDEMIIWGGYTPVAINTGAKYNPISDTWTAITTTNVPEGRYYHTAVWTGDEMIVWGGNIGASVFTDTGGKYNPLTDSWSSVTSRYAPTRRYYHTAVWTGTKMIIWGGQGQDYTGPILNSGGRYKP